MHIQTRYESICVVLLSIAIMLNFSGSTKKRVVNLGDKKAPRGKSFLEQSKFDRLQRELARQKEKSARLISRYIARRLELLSVSDAFLHQWQTASTNDNRGLVKALQFDFIAKFGRRNDTLVLLDPLTHMCNSGEITRETQEIYIRALARALERVSSPFAVVDCLIILCEHYGPPSALSRRNQLVKTLTLMFCSTGERSLVKAILLLCAADGLLIPLLARIPHDFLSDLPDAVRVIHSSLCGPDASPYIAKLLDVQKIQLLVNTLAVEGETSNCAAHANILSHMHFSIAASEDSMEDSIQETHLTNQRVLEVSSKTFSVILKLYQTSYLNHAIDMLTNQSDHALAIHSLALLMHLVPEYKPRICMLMSITPNLDQWVFSKLSVMPAFTQIRLCDGDRLSSDALFELANSTPNDSFWDLLYIYEQLLSYWIIVANNVADNALNPFNLDQLVEFCLFLKKFCLTLIFCTNEATAATTRNFRELKESSISLLNQLYMKNLHLKHLPNDFWKLQLIKFEINLMIQIILEEDAQRIAEGSDSSSDEDARVGFSRHSKSTKPRTLDMTSKLEILSRVPFFVEFFDRVKVFQSLLKADQNRILSRSDTAMFYEGVNDKLTADIHRETLLEDAFAQFRSSGPQFKNKIQVTFYNEHGPEAGIDGGGLTKEFLTSVVAEGFSPNSDLHLFKETEAENELYPNDDVYLKIAKRIDLPEQEQRLLYLRFLGMIVGKCLYESVLIDIAFAPFFLANWKVAHSAQSSIDDLAYLDTQLYTSLSKLLTMSAEEIQSLDLSFVINEQVGADVLLYDLAPPNGDSIAVSKSNRLQYVHLIANFKLKRSLQVQTKYFLEGLFEVIDAQWLNMFDPFELQMLISGGNDIDVQDWKQNVHYGGYFDDDITVNLFWEVVEEMSPQERCALVKFVTSVSRAPLLGFKALSPHFGIHNSGSLDRLPTASTCVNLLKLPDYKDKRLIRDKLLYATQANSGFDLS